MRPLALRFLPSFHLGAEQQQKLNKRINQVPFLKTKDKLCALIYALLLSSILIPSHSSFVLGISLMVIIEYIVLEAPRFLPLLYTALVFPVRTNRASLLFASLIFTIVVALSVL